MKRSPAAPARIVAAAAILVLVAACTPMETATGYVPDEDLIAQIKPGVQGPDEVAEILGSPSSVATFTARKNTWYYITRRSEAIAFFKPRVLEQQVVAVEFGADGKVAEVRRYTLADGREIVPVGRTTPTRGKELGLLEQLFGNIGRFNSGAPAE